MLGGIGGVPDVYHFEMLCGRLVVFAISILLVVVTVAFTRLFQVSWFLSSESQGCGLEPAHCEIAGFFDRQENSAYME
jgi:sugar phosphate permease